MGLTTKLRTTPPSSTPQKTTAEHPHSGVPDDEDLRSTTSTSMSSYRPPPSEQHGGVNMNHVSLETASVASSGRTAKSAGSSAASTAATSTAILHKGYLTVKKGLLKGYEKRFYFLVRHTSELFSFKDEGAFLVWMSYGQPMNAAAKGCAPPTIVCTVLRADRAGDGSSTSDRAIAVMAGDSSKFESRKFIADSVDACEDWIRAFHQIQVKKRGDQKAHRPPKPTHQPGPHHSDDTASEAGSRTNTMPSVASGRSRDDERSVISSAYSDSQDSSDRTSSRRPARRSAPSVSTPSAPATASGPVLLFVPAAGTTLAVSDSKLARAKEEMETLAKQGAKRPDRAGIENLKDTAWRYGVPEYTLSDLCYMKGTTRDHESTPLESYIESCCQTFVMEATHKAVYKQWISVRHDYFHLQVNDGARIPGSAIKENDMFGMLYLNDYDAVDVDLKEGEDQKDPRAVLAEALTEGFPMEVLQVFTQPPQCYFSWRHWGPFTGRYKGVKGDGSMVEVRGFGQLHIESNRMLHLRLFFKQRDLFDQLHQIVQRIQPPSSTTSTSKQPADVAVGDFIKSS